MSVKFFTHLMYPAFYYIFGETSIEISYNVGIYKQMTYIKS